MDYLYNAAYCRQVLHIERHTMSLEKAQMLKTKHCLSHEDFVFKSGLLYVYGETVVPRDSLPTADPFSLITF